jgi:hypothetical protein
MTSEGLESVLSGLLQRLRAAYPDVERAVTSRTFDLPAGLDADRVRVDGDPNAVRVSVHDRQDDPGDWHVVYDHAARVAELRDEVTRSLEQHPALAAPLGDAFAGDYKAARTALDKADLDDATQRRFRAVVNRELLADRSREWTVHGPQRCFRFWSDEEKVDYVRRAADTARDLAELSPNVCFGFGAALSVVRDGDLIPHDDDLDIIIGFDPEEAASLPAALKLVEQHMRGKGYVVRGNFMAHRHVAVGRNKHVDVFVGLFEGDDIAWYPGKRGGLTRAIMFPATSRQLLGVACPLPAQPETYLERLYGPTWHTPDPNFRHRWDSSAYADQRGAPTAPAKPAVAPPAAPKPAPTAATTRLRRGARRRARRLVAGVRRRLRRPSRR